MVNFEYHKGQCCSYKDITCQEGYCSECLIYVNFKLCMESLYLRGNNLHINKVKKAPNLQVVYNK
jgi:hypothetical protein